MRSVASTSLSTMCFGVGPSGLPIDRSITSSPRRRAAIFSSLVMLKTYGGRRRIRSNSRIAARILAVKLQLAGTSARNTITGYGAGYVMVNGARHEENLIVLADRILPWSAARFEALGAENFLELAKLDLEVVLLGTGATLRFPGPQVT